jgi:hypothetical protein
LKSVWKIHCAIQMYVRLRDQWCLHFLGIHRDIWWFSLHIIFSWQNILHYHLADKYVLLVREWWTSRKTVSTCLRTLRCGIFWQAFIPQANAGTCQCDDVSWIQINHARGLSAEFRRVNRCDIFWMTPRNNKWTTLTNVKHVLHQYWFLVC